MLSPLPFSLFSKGRRDQVYHFDNIPQPLTRKERRFRARQRNDLFLPRAPLPAIDPLIYMYVVGEKCNVKEEGGVEFHKDIDGERGGME